MIHSIVSLLTIDSADVKKATRAHFKMVHTLLPENYIITSENDCIVDAAVNVSGAIVKGKSTTTIKIATHIYRKRIEPDGPDRFSDHYISDGNNDKTQKLREMF